MKEMLRKSDQNYDEVALDYQAAGLNDEANAIWSIAITEGAVTPMTYYYMGRYDEAIKADLTYCFPNRPEAIIALEAAKVNNPKDSQAPYLLGCLYYAARQYDLAMQNWQLSADINPAFPTVWRNLALGTFNKLGQEQEALEMMERAFHLDENDERLLMELDQLYKRLHHNHTERLQFLQKYPHLIQRRDDLVLEEITLLNEVGRYEEAMQKLDSHIFHPWEGGEGKVPTQYQIARVELAKKAIADKDYDNAIKLLNECLEYPHHLGEGKLYGAQENDFYYLLGVAYDAIGQKNKARECWEEATKGPQEPAAAMYYNDAKPDKIFYQGMALYRLGRSDEAHGRFYRLINYGKQHIFEKQMMDYFAVSLPDLLIWEDSLDTKNLIHCKYMLALGYYGMDDVEHAERYLEEVEALDNNHQGIQQFRTFISTNL
jgi:tetratricopeptide (TPR) repeat protein